MNAALKKYKCHYKRTRFAKLTIQNIKFLRGLAAASVVAAGISRINAVRCSFLEKSEKIAAIKHINIKTEEAAKAASNSIPLPRWYNDN